MGGWGGKVEEENCQRAKLNTGGSFFRKKKKIFKRGFLGKGYRPVPFGRKWKLDKKYYEIDVFQFYSSWGLGFLRTQEGQTPVEEEKWSGQRGLGVQR